MDVAGEDFRLLAGAELRSEFRSHGVNIVQVVSVVKSLADATSGQEAGAVESGIQVRKLSGQRERGHLDTVLTFGAALIGIEGRLDRRRNRHKIFPAHLILPFVSASGLFPRRADTILHLRNGATISSTFLTILYKSLIPCRFHSKKFAVFLAIWRRYSRKA